MIDELVGQLIWGFISASDEIAGAEEAARRGHLSGIWLLPTEMRSASETAMLVNQFQMASPRPLLVGVDAEAGLGLVMGTATQLPTAMALGAAADPMLARDAALVTAAEAAACGINAIGAPVLDVNVSPRNPIINSRAFGGTPDLVASMGVAFIDALRTTASRPGGVLPIGKHFPGHGDTRLDSHLHLESVDEPRVRLEAVELAPFRAAIDACVPMLMTAHVAYPALDPTGLPATLSRPILTDLLRGELGYAGAVVTDCMNMHAITNNFDAAEAAVQAVLAGCDLVLTDQWSLTLQALVRAALEGRIPMGRLEEAAERVAQVKLTIFGDRHAHPHPVDPQLAHRSVGTRAHGEVADRIADASITLVAGEPAPPSSRPLIMATRMARRFGFGPPVEVQVRAALHTIGWEDADVHMVDPVPDAVDMRKAIEHAESAGWVALLHFNRVQSFDPDAVAISEELMRLLEQVTQKGIPATVVSMGSPYALPGFGVNVAQLCSYSTCDASLRATLRVLKGDAPARGRLPVELRPPSLAH
jgi:beta-N-acetylhexosaminidase